MFALSPFKETAALSGLADLPGLTALPGLADLPDEGVIRAYYLEISQNIEILKTVDSAALKDQSLHTPGFKSLVQSLETGAGFALLCSGIGKRKRIRSFLEETLVIQSPGRTFALETGGEDEDVKTPEVFALRIDVLKAVWFTVSKIEQLKKLAALDLADLADPAGSPFTHNFKLHVRVSNILERFKKLRKKLNEHEAVKPLW